MAVESRYNRKIPPILGHFSPFQIRDFSETSFGRRLEGLDGIWVIRLPDCIRIESIVLTFAVDQNGIVFPIEGTADGGRSVVSPDDLIQQPG